MIIILFIVLAAAALFLLLRVSKTQSDQSWREDNSDGSFSIYDKKDSVTIVKTYEGERYIDGHPCRDADDMERWYVMKGFSEGIERRLSEIESQLICMNTDGADTLISEWDERYEQYRQLCIDHGFWNAVINDRAVFIPTMAQSLREKEKKQQVLKLREMWQQRMNENKIVLDYLEGKPRRHAVKNEMIKALSEGDEEKKKIQSIYRRLKKAGIIAEKENKEGKIETRIVLHKKTERMPKLLPPSVYHPSLYANVQKKDVYKVDYTVGKPQELDRDSNSCIFISKSSGEKYRTSLEQCTCPAYYKGGVCKHMIALSMNLAYFNRNMIVRK